MSKQQRGLGKGLGALLGGDADLNQIRKPVGYVNKEVVDENQPQQGTADIMRIPVDMIEPNPYQPRMNFDQEALEELAQEDMGAYLSGFVLLNENGIEIGRITDYYDYPNNPCIEIEPAEGVRSSLSDVEDGDSPILIPFQEQFIIAFDPEQRKIQMEVPSGLIVF